jgi:hypothetical protein
MGTDKRSAAIIREIQSWSENSGSEWTLERLKTLKRCVIQYVSSDTLQTAQKFLLPSGSWIKASSNGWPKGHLGGLIKDVLLNGGITHRKLGLLLSILEVGKTFKRPEVTAAQSAKFLEAINGDPVREDLYDFSYKAGAYCFKDTSSNEGVSFTFRYKKNHHFSFAGLNSAKPSTSFMTKEMKQIHPWLYSLIEGSALNGPWTPILTSMGIPVKQGPEAIFGGKITILQEGGLKARVIAVPVAAAQVAFKPLHETLNALLRRNPSDCTHDQSRGIQWGQRKLKEGNVLHAVDLSSATDNFPLGFQCAVLDGLGYEYTDEFKKFCKLKFGFPGKSLEYTKGQPMGLYGSFALFAYSHHVLLRHIEKKIGVFDTYRILGDDIIISNDEVHKQYLLRMKTLGVPISYHKCLDSDLFTEFAGKLISPLGVVDVAKAPSLKDGLVNIDQFINYCKVTGTYQYAIKGVPKQYRNFAKRVVALPEHFGGLGINPQGLSVEDRLVSFEKSKERSFPLKRDLGSSLIKAKALSNGNEHVGQVCSFINDQLMKIHQEIDDDLSTYDHLYASIGDYDIKRAVLQQLADSLQRDNPMPYIGTLRTNKSQDSIYRQWKEALFSAEASLERKLDNSSQEELDIFSSDSFLVKEDPEFADRTSDQRSKTVQASWTELGM